jgi:PhnB protein
MGSVRTYLNFQGNCEEAFAAYAAIFESESYGLTRFGDAAAMPPLSDNEQRLVMIVGLTILGGHVLLGSDMLASMGHHTRIGNNTTLVLEVDSRDEADRYYEALSAGGGESSPMADMFWGAYWGVCLDRFGIRWMINFTHAND